MESSRSGQLLVWSPLPRTFPQEPATAVTGPASANKAAPAKGPKAESSPAAQNDSIVGQPLAPGMMELLRNEMVTQLRSRGVADHFARFQDYARQKLSSSASAYTGSELTGNCRLRWYDHLLRNPLLAPAEAEEFTPHPAPAHPQRPCGAGSRAADHCGQAGPRPAAGAALRRRAFSAGGGRSAQAGARRCPNGLCGVAGPLEQERSPPTEQLSLSGHGGQQQRRTHAERPRHGAADCAT